MKDLPLRFLTAMVLGIVVIGSIYYSYLSFSLLLLLISVLSGYEYLRLAAFGAEISNPEGIKRLGAALTGLPLALSILPGSSDVQGSAFIILMVTLLAMSFLFSYFLFKNEAGDWRLYQAVCMALIYIGLPLLLFRWVAAGSGQYEWLKPMTLLLLIWCNDIGAYFTGRTFGKRKLYVLVSPNKTLEGFFGGLILTITCGLVLSIYVHPLSPVQWVFYAFIISILSTIGDLFESLIKRRYGVKDSGSLLPGHGGFLDRFDAFIFVLPASGLFLYLFWNS
ncbi:MAG TPA: phosphatidate cytidylyltransferase [Saprospiraceae bacterium]|nr:phosphatidate cytidylyltransferase [Saprospiraceae bacterium]HNT22267.1 phosphatidate cytidylyltransferase [Saprospiraceae bacterium]